MRVRNGLMKRRGCRMRMMGSRMMGGMDSSKVLFRISLLFAAESFFIRFRRLKLLKYRIVYGVERRAGTAAGLEVEVSLAPSHVP